MLEILLIGGEKNRKAFYSFSFVSEKWTRLSNLQKERFWHGSVVMNDGIYIVGGWNNKDIDRFDPTTRTFRKVKSLKESRRDFGICQYDSQHLIFAGSYDYDNREFLNTSYLYNITTNSLKQVGKLNTARSGLVLIKNEAGSIFAIGGSNKQGKILKTIEKFDKKSQTWKVINAKLKIGRFQHRAVAYKHYIFVIGGKQQNQKMTNSIEKIDTTTGEVEVIKTKLRQARRNFAVAKHGHLVYIIGGDVTHYSKKYEEIFTRSMEVLNLENETVQEGKSIPFADRGFTAHIL